MPPWSRCGDWCGRFADQLIPAEAATLSMIAIGDHRRKGRVGPELEVERAESMPQSIRRL